MIKNEVKDIFKKLQGGQIRVMSDDTYIKSFDEKTIPSLVDCDVNCFDLLKLSKAFERPDSYYLSSDGVLYLIEHFEVDITKKDIKVVNGETKGSSPCKKEYSLLDKRIKNEFSKNADCFISGKLNIIGTIQDFVDSVEYSVNKHYTKIQDYINRVKVELKDEEIKDIKVIFLMENSMKFGAYFIENREIVDISLFEYTNFLDIFKNKVDVDYFMYFTYRFLSGDSQIMYVASQKYLSQKDGYMLDGSKELDCSHNEVAFKSIISEKELLEI